MPGLTGGRPLSWTVSTAVCQATEQDCNWEGEGRLLHGGGSKRLPGRGRGPCTQAVELPQQGKGPGRVHQVKSVWGLFMQGDIQTP